MSFMNVNYNYFSRIVIFFYCKKKYRFYLNYFYMVTWLQKRSSLRIIFHRIRTHKYLLDVFLKIFRHYGTLFVLTDDNQGKY